MKKTLFTMLALATMMPAIAFAEIGNLIVGEGNWELGVVFVDPYESFTDYTKYTLYLTEQDNTDITSVKTMLEGKTFSEFTTTIAGCKEVKFKEYYDWINLFHTAYDVVTEFPSSIDPRVNIWGVCIYQHEDFVRFQVVPVHDLNEQICFIHFDTSRLSGSGYTSFAPEPATATLSLLALAGLASRRKRK